MNAGFGWQARMAVAGSSARQIAATLCRYISHSDRQCYYMTDVALQTLIVARSHHPILSLVNAALVLVARSMVQSFDRILANTETLVGMCYRVFLDACTRHRVVSMVIERHA
jgi:hypothetical protein